MEKTTTYQLTPQKSSIELVKSNITFKCKISDSLEKEIRHICTNIWDVEWSGILFYNVEGSFETEDLVIKPFDLYLMDIGTSGFTSFNMTPEVTAYMLKNNLIGCNMGLIHSHNNMNTFFSGTDISTLNTEGEERDNFVSLIVNNKGSYTAAVTRKKVVKQQVKESGYYTSFNATKVDYTDIFEVEDTSLEYFMLNVEFESAFNNSTRIQELKTAATRAITTPTYNWENPYYKNYEGYITTSNSTPNTIKNEEKFTLKGATENSVKEKSKTTLPITIIKSNIVNECVTQLLTGSVAIPKGTKVSNSKWSQNMIQLFDKRFGKDSNMDKFEIWADSFVEFICWYSSDEDTPIEPEVMAYNLKLALEKLPKNKYINSYIKILNGFIK